MFKTKETNRNGTSFGWLYEPTNESVSKSNQKEVQNNNEMPIYSLEAEVLHQAHYSKQVNDNFCTFTSS